MSTKRKDLTGMVFGRVTITEFSHSERRGCFWKGICTCKNPVLAASSDFIAGRVNSCGCITKDKSGKILTEDLTGKKFGRLTVLEFVGMFKRNQLWKCSCSCGNTKTIRKGGLTRGTPSCGCLKKEGLAKRNRTHGMSSSPEYRLWSGMITRCTNSDREDWSHYGGRGITVCDSWMSFENFYRDMGPRPFPKAEIDRINNDDGYYKENCRWATRSVNVKNTRRGVLVVLNGEQMNVIDAERALGLRNGTVWGYTKSHGVSHQEAVDHLKLRCAQRAYAMSSAVSCAGESAVSPFMTLRCAVVLRYGWQFGWNAIIAALPGTYVSQAPTAACPIS